MTESEIEHFLAGLEPSLRRRDQRLVSVVVVDAACGPEAADAPYRGLFSTAPRSTQLEGGASCPL